MRLFLRSGLPVDKLEWAVKLSWAFQMNGKCFSALNKGRQKTTSIIFKKELNSIQFFIVPEFDLCLRNT